MIIVYVNGIEMRVSSRGDIYRNEGEAEGGRGRSLAGHHGDELLVVHLEEVVKGEVEGVVERMARGMKGVVEGGERAERPGRPHLCPPPGSSRPPPRPSASPPS